MDIFAVAVDITALQKRVWEETHCFDDPRFAMREFLLAGGKVKDCAKTFGVCTRTVWKYARKQDRLMSRTPAQRFWSKVEKGEDCWNWQGSGMTNGYGSFSIGRKTLSAHRFSYEIAHGEIPQGLYVCHRCDNRRCVNPKHLFLGTAKDNEADKVRKGRQAYGEKNGCSKLTWQEVDEIRDLSSQGISQRKIATIYNVSQRAIWQVVNYRKWKGLHIENTALQEQDRLNSLPEPEEDAPRER